tara:strand:- start:49 stop:399 length:351 start_codon:yes stop_codon:yes gene_type:complete
MNFLLIKRMMKKTNYILILLLTLPIFLNACQGIKDGLSGRKSENSDEFLVKKKDALVVPPDFMKLPKPGSENFNDEISKLEEETDIKKILNINTDSSEKSKKKFGSAEEFVLKNIK